MGTVQRQEHLLVVTGQPLERQLLAAQRHLPCRDPEVDALEDHSRAHLLGPLEEDLRDGPRVGRSSRVDRVGEQAVPERVDQAGRRVARVGVDDELRDELIPVNSRWKVDEALDAAYSYYQKTGRRVSIEYALIKDMNDHAWRAALLGKKLNDRGKGWVHVNPIPLNPTPGSIWTASLPDVTRDFVYRLDRAGIPTTLRDTRGKEIDGACGQLAAAD